MEAAWASWSEPWLAALQAFHFLRPWWLLALPLGFLIAWLLRRHAEHSDWQAFIDPPLLQALLLRPAQQGRLTPQRLANIMLCLWVLALAGPSWQQEAPPWVDDQSPLVIVLHLGGSMLTEDRQPDRLTLAKTKINQMLDDRSGGATALVAYSGSAHSVLPLTQDTGVLKYYLQDLRPDVLPVEGNRPDLGLQKAADLLRGQGGSVVWVTDSLDGFFPQQRDWNPFAGRGQPERESAAVKVLALALVPDQKMADQLAAVDIERVTVTADDRDLQSLAARMDRQWQQQLQADDSLQWRDNGYYLVWPLLLVALLWFRRGMVLPW